MAYPADLLNTKIYLDSHRISNVFEHYTIKQYIRERTEVPAGFGMSYVWI